MCTLHNRLIRRQPAPVLFLLFVSWYLILLVMFATCKKENSASKTKSCFSSLFFRYLSGTSCVRFNGRIAHPDRPARTAVPPVPSSGLGARTPHYRAHPRRPDCLRRRSSCPMISSLQNHSGKTVHKCLQVLCNFRHYAVYRACLRDDRCHQGRTPASEVHAPLLGRWSARHRRSCSTLRAHRLGRANRGVGKEASARFLIHGRQSPPRTR